MGVPCYTLRANTERPITITQGTNTLIGEDPAAIGDIELAARARAPRAIPLWDGRAAERVADVLGSALASSREPVASSA